MIHDSNQGPVRRKLCFHKTCRCSFLIKYTSRLGNACSGRSGQTHFVHRKQDKAERHREIPVICPSEHLETPRRVCKRGQCRAPTVLAVAIIATDSAHASAGMNVATILRRSATPATTAANRAAPAIGISNW